MLIRRLLYWSNFTVIRWQLLFSILAFWFVSAWLKDNYGKDDSTTWFVISEVFFLVLKWILISLFGFCLLSALVSWAFFLFRMSNGSVSVQVKFGEDEKAAAGLVPLSITVRRALRPFLGSVRARIVFPKHELSEFVLLDEGVYEKGSLIRSGIRGQGKAMLHDRGIYDVKEVDVFFSDMFRLFSLPVTFHFNKQLYTLPKELAQKDIKAEPNTSEEQTHRIEIPKRVEGEFLNYKNFESGDDVRRIVWKIYARSGELVVRIPETMDPYASHLYFYASFFNGMKDESDGLYSTELLNGYKDKLLNMFEALKKNGFDLRFPHDQETPKLAGVGEKNNEVFHIAAASWQQGKMPSEFVDRKKAAFVCVSSLAPEDDIYSLLSNLPLNVPVVAIRMSDAIESPFRKFKFKSVFVIPEEQPEDKLSGPWMVSSLRAKLLKNEQQLAELFRRRGNAFLIGTKE